LLAEPVQILLDDFQPQAIIIAAGFDAHKRDDMSGLNYSTELYEQLGRKVKAWERTFCPGSLLSILEGGYDLESLADSVKAYLAGLLE